ncbi:nucleotidyl transferase AbiEii/AbiGii toxin family protein [Synechococcus sp.]|uniref:nucleotidyl transferase AbiEii/AbiGii toxin family protein n=1 Tax=Synechococcus sp. TaxID=1131 RepID=UPI0034A2E222
MNRVVEQMLQSAFRQAGDSRSGAKALREVMQEIALAGLYRRGFFGKAAFYGGTCLRIFHQLARFSEDLDFSLLQSRIHSFCTSSPTCRVWRRSLPPWESAWRSR